MTPAELDQIANRYEREWGVGRLPLLVSAQTAQRFQSAMDFLAADFPPAGRSWDDVRASVARGWAALAAEATQRGHAPLPPAIHEIPLEGCPGAVAAICLDDAHAQAVLLRAKAEGRAVNTWTLAEVVRVIQANELVNVIKDRFPGATVLPFRARSSAPMPDDEIPFGDTTEEPAHA